MSTADCTCEITPAVVPLFNAEERKPLEQGRGECLLEYREVKLLVDAIYHTTDPFSTPPASRVVRNAGRRAPF